MHFALRLCAACLAVAAAGCTTESTIGVGGDNGGGGATRRSSTTRGGGGTTKSSTSEGSSASSGGSGSSSDSATTSTTSQASSSSGGSTTSMGLVCGASGGGSGTNQLFNCTNVNDYSGDAGSCTQAWLGSQVIDYETCTPVCGATVEAVDPTGVTIGGTQQLSGLPNGYFEFCLPPDTTFEPTVTAPGYSNFVYAEVKGELSVGIPMLGMLSSVELSAFAVFITGGLDPAKGALVAFFVPASSCSGTSPEAGWTISLTDVNGTPYPDGGYNTLYIDSSGFPSATLTATSPYGVALLYDIDPTVGQFAKVQATNPSSSCQVVNQFVGFTGRLEVGPNLFSEQGIFLE
jgi:hypothetical protein